MSHASAIPSRCDNVPDDWMPDIVGLVLALPAVMISCWIDFIFTAYMTLPVLLIIILLTPLHERLHQIGFNWGGYDSEIRLWHYPPHVIARRQHVDARTWIIMEIAPLVGIAILLVLFTPPISVILGAGRWETIIITLLSLGFHFGSAGGDFYYLWKFKLNYGDDATAYLIDTVDEPDNGPYEMYYCPPKNTNSNTNSNSNSN